MRAAETVSPPYSMLKYSIALLFHRVEILQNMEYRILQVYFYFSHTGLEALPSKKKVYIHGTCVFISDVPGLLIDQENLENSRQALGFNWSSMVGDCLRLACPL